MYSGTIRAVLFLINSSLNLPRVLFSKIEKAENVMTKPEITKNKSTPIQPILNHVKGPSIGKFFQPVSSITWRTRTEIAAKALNKSRLGKYKPSLVLFVFTFNISENLGYSTVIFWNVGQILIVSVSLRKNSYSPGSTSLNPDSDT